MSRDQELAVVSKGELTAVEIRKQVNLIQQVLKDVMKEGTHYGIVPGCGDKKTLLKPGAEKIAMTFRLSADFNELTGSFERDDHILYKIDCTLTHIPTGLVVGHGRGTCSSKEKKYRTRSVFANKATEEEKSIGKPEKRTGRNGTFDVFVIPQDPWDVQNTLYKMACKRAQVAAILNATAASDIFTQDIEELPEGTVIEGEDHEPKPEIKQPQKKEAGAPATAPAPATEDPAPAPAKTAKNPISEAQGKRLFAIAVGNGWTAEDIEAYLIKDYGINHSKLVEREWYEDVVKHFQQKKEVDA